ncbi:MAG: ATP-dependent Clp protease ATP-binding subunit, partial [bacterium]
MQPVKCARCHKNVAVIFITKMENGKTTNEGLCLKCARELNIGPVNDIMNKMGLSEDDMDQMSQEMLQAFGGAEELPEGSEEDEDEEEGKTATFPFLNRLFSGDNAPAPSAPKNEEKPPRASSREKKEKHKFLDAY